MKSVALAIFMVLATAGIVIASEAANASENGHGGVIITIGFMAVILLLANSSHIVEKFGLPTVVGELAVGLFLGNLVLVGITVFEPIKTSEVFQVLAEVGVILLLFLIGLESSISAMKNVGVTAFFVALIGVAVPMALGVLAGPILMPGMDQNAYLFMGAALAATSVGITSRVFQELKWVKSKEATIVLGAAVIDDVLGLIILAVITGIVTTGGFDAVEAIRISGLAVLFLVGSLGLGYVFAPRINRFIANKVHSGHRMKQAIAVVFCFSYAFIAQEIFGLAAIIGAFAAGLILTSVHFRDFDEPHYVQDLRGAIANIDNPEAKGHITASAQHYADKHVEDLINPVANIFIPFFFVYTGMNVNLEVFFDIDVMTVALGITLIAVIGKIVSGIVVPKGASKLIVGTGMVPRGEVGLIFASIGLALGVANDQMYSVIVAMVILTTILTPPVLAFLIKRKQASEPVSI